MVKTHGNAQIATDRADLDAFRVSEKISDDAMEDLAEYMIGVFGPPL